MIVYGVKRGPFGAIWLRRWFTKISSDKNKRTHKKIKKYRKTWWHFRTRWDPSD